MTAHSLIVVRGESWTVLLAKVFAERGVGSSRFITQCLIHGAIYWTEASMKCIHGVSNYFRKGMTAIIFQLLDLHEARLRIIEHEQRRPLLICVIVAVEVCLRPLSLIRKSEKQCRGDRY